VEVQGGIFQDLHDVMYMSINHGETIDDFKERGKVDVRESLHKHKPDDAWTIIFGLITINLVNDDIYHGLVSNSFVIMLFILVHCVYVYRIMDGGVQGMPHSNQDT
jgi:hypothetical protein